VKINSEPLPLYIKTFLCEYWILRLMLVVNQDQLTIFFFLSYKIVIQNSLFISNEFAEID